MQTAATALLGCRHPIVLAGMGGPARSALVAAVTGAGGFGFLGMVREPPRLIESEVARLRAQGIARFGVNIIPHATDPDLLARQLDTIIDLRVPVVGLFWDIDAAAMARLRAAGIILVYQVGSPEEARAAVAAGAQAIIAQGCEAGGHVRGTTPLRHLLPAVAQAVDVPVLAAGGLARGSDLVVARALGADGVVMGTAFLAATESFAHAHHKRRLVVAEADETVLTEAFHINWPPGARVRVLTNGVTAGRHGDPWGAERVVIGEEDGRPIYLFGTDSPLQSMTGDMEAMALYAGTGVGAVTAIRDAGAIVATILDEAADAERQGQGGPIVLATETSSPVCYAGDMSARYAGALEPDEVEAEMRDVIAGLRGLIVAEGGPGPRPPFGPGAVEWARWIALLGGGARGPVPDDPAPGETLRRRLRLMLPRLPETVLRARLMRLADRLEERSVPEGSWSLSPFR